jgi:hypothetical protein
MLFWECRRRLELLIRFRGLALEYFKNTQPAAWMAGPGMPPTENETAAKSRIEINKLMHDLTESFALIGIEPCLRWTPPPVLGGYVQSVDVVTNMFGLWQFQIPPSALLDNTERAIGRYESEFRRLRRKLFNPFYWAGLLIVAILRLPFKLLGAAGFNAAKAENSLLGKMFKVAVGTVLFFAAVVPAALELSDHWDKVRRFGGVCLTALHRLN